MSNIKISVVIPIYNSEKYIEQCLDSIINQTLEDIEIICVNDGSTDNSSNILNKYMKDDSRVIVINSDHKGAGSARNVGLNCSHGKYISFIDSDDWIDEETYENLYLTIESKNADIIMFKMLNYDEKTNKYCKTEYYNLTPLNEFSNGEVFNYQNIEEILKIAVSPCNKIYKNSFLKEISVKFPEGLIFEDNPFFFETFLNAKRVVFYDEYLYYRRRREDSIMNSINEKHFDIIPISNKILDIFKDNNLYETYKSSLLNKKITLIRTVYDNLDDKHKHEFFNMMKKDFSIINEDYLLKERNDSDIAEISSYFYLNLILSKNFKEFDFLNLKYQFDRLKDKYNGLKKRNRRLIKCTDDLQKALEKEKHEKNNSDENNSRCEEELKKVYSSKSWKITKPLRMFKKRLK
jgi:glycosyltransferase involved in cell wall biosynthesis